jgi:hypothetical protein
MSDKIYHKMPGTISGEDVESAPAPREETVFLARKLCNELIGETGSAQETIIARYFANRERQGGRA